VIDATAKGKRRDKAKSAKIRGVSLSLGLLSKIEKQCTKQLEEPYQEALEATQSAPASHADETSWSYGGIPGWLWIASTGCVARFLIDDGRGGVQHFASSDPMTNRWSSATAGSPTSLEDVAKFAGLISIATLRPSSSAEAELPESVTACWISLVFVERALTTVTSLRAQGRNVFAFLRDLLSPGSPTPSLLPSTS
jgi:hypothetical protein